jgi:hypothetical protein
MPLVTTRELAVDCADLISAVREEAVVFVDIMRGAATTVDEDRAFANGAFVTSVIVIGVCGERDVVASSD